MKAIFNSRLISIEKLSLDHRNRAFCYGDGLFETIVTGPNRINLIDFHLERLIKGCTVLGIRPPEFSSFSLTKMISDLAEENQVQGNIRARLQVWRENGGLYTPENSNSCFLLEVAESITNPFSQAETIGIAEKAIVNLSPTSFAKTMSALPYVLAGVERKAKNWDDIILLNGDGYLAETHIANLFWVKEGKLYTPSLSTGCIEGVMRKWILNQIEVEEVKEAPVVLESAEMIFSTNASGIKYFRTFNGKEYKSPETILGNLITQLQPL